MNFNEKYYKNIIDHHGSKVLLENFVNEKLLNYKAKRNFDYGSYKQNCVSSLSPAICRRILTEKDIVKRISNQFTYGQVEKFIDEICWRTYWKGWLEHRPQVWYDYLIELKQLKPLKLDSLDYKNAIIGNTGLECFDTWVNHLLKFGYLHNHTRMWFASLWIFHFKLPWQLGAELFYQNLLDADSASNTLSWRWVAGLQTKGKKYIASTENINRFTNNRFSFPSKLILSEEEVPGYKFYEPIHVAVKSNSSKAKNKGHLIIEEDLSFVNVDKDSPVIIQSKSYNKFGQSEYVESFSNKALENAIRHCKNEISHKVSTFTWDNTELIKDWIETNSLDEIEIIAPTIGKYDKLIPRLMDRFNINIIYYYHDWDTSFWKYSDKGFFKMKKQIKNIITQFWETPLFKSF
jgi:deoxyribodipyrimidine photo-lyase